MTDYNLQPQDSISSTNLQLTIPPLGIDSDSTDLTFLGRGYANYGQIQQTNVLKLLENFASINEPTHPIVGQIWYNPSTEMLNICVSVDRTIPNNFVVTWVTVQDMSAITATPGNVPATTKKGALWYDFSAGRLKVYDGSTWITVVSDAVVSLNTIAPTSPLHGQLWYDLTTSTLKAWNSTSNVWIPISISAVQDDSLKYAFILAM